MDFKKRIDKSNISFASVKQHNQDEKEYWKTVSYDEKCQAITYLRECFYGEAATTGRLQRIYTFFKRQ